MVANTSELLPEPDTPVNTVKRRFGISTLMSLRLFSRAPCTRIRSWLSAACSAGGCGYVLVAMLIVSPSVRPGRLHGLRRVAGLDLISDGRCLVRLRRERESLIIGPGAARVRCRRGRSRWPPGGHH